METRKLRIIFNKSGSGTISTKIALPKIWVDNMLVTKEEREVNVTFVDNKIIIEKSNNE